MSVPPRQLLILGRQLLTELRNLKESVNKQCDSAHSDKEREPPDENVRPPWPDQILSFYQEFERKKTISEDRQHRIQKSICKATWCAFFAVLIYAGVTLLIWRANQQAADAARVAAQAAKESADLASKQMEATGAAIIEMAHPMSVQFPVPPYGEVRANLMNSGHVIAHSVILSFTASLNKVDGAQRRELLSKTEIVPAIEPSIVITRPDFIYPFQLSRDEYRLVTQTEAYISIKGHFTYENGFERTASQTFCYAYVSGSRIGSWGGTCSEAAIIMHMQKKLEGDQQKNRH